MSPPTDRSVDRPAVGSHHPGPRSPVAHLSATLSTAGAALGYLSFWTAVCLPVLLVALLVTGIETAAQARAFLLVTAVECVALVAGRAHLPE